MIKQNNCGKINFENYFITHDFWQTLLPLLRIFPENFAKRSRKTMKIIIMTIG